MSRDFTTFFEICLGIFLLSWFAWLKYRSDASDQRKKLLRNLAVCIAISGITGFDTLCQFSSPRAEVAGPVVDSHVAGGRFDDSYFQVQADSGQTVRLATVKKVARDIDTTQRVHVVYAVWDAHPVEIEITSGDRQGVLLSLKDGDHVSGLELFLFIVFLALAVLTISQLRALPCDADV